MLKGLVLVGFFGFYQLIVHAMGKFYQRIGLISKDINLFNGNNPDTYLGHSYFAWSIIVLILFFIVTEIIYKKSKGESFFDKVLGFFESFDEF